MDCTSTNLELFYNYIDKWIQDEQIDKKKIAYTVYHRSNPSFSSYDDWKLASRDDYYDETEVVEQIDIQSLTSFFYEKWEDEVTTEALSQEDDAYLFAKEYFEDLYSEWEENEIAHLEEQCEKDTVDIEYDRFW